MRETKKPLHYCFTHYLRVTTIFKNNKPKENNDIK